MVPFTNLQHVYLLITHVGKTMIQFQSHLRAFTYLKSIHHTISSANHCNLVAILNSIFLERAIQLLRVISVRAKCGWKKVSFEKGLWWKVSDSIFRFCNTMVYERFSLFSVFCSRTHTYITQTTIFTFVRFCTIDFDSKYIFCTYKDVKYSFPNDSKGCCNDTELTSSETSWREIFARHLLSELSLFRLLLCRMGLMPHLQEYRLLLSFTMNYGAKIQKWVFIINHDRLFKKICSIALKALYSTLV